MKKNYNQLKVSLVINYMIVIFTIIATIIMFTGFKFMNGKEPVLETTTFGVFRFFTVDSNILMGIVAYLFLRKEKKLLSGKITDIPVKYYVLKLIGTTAVTLTFIVVFAYLSRIVDGGIMPLLMNSNLFFHLIIPLLSILTFTVFEKTNKLKFKYTFFGMLPTIIYGIYYVINLLIHLENGKVLPKYDWYWFVQSGLNNIYIIGPGLIVVSFIISIILAWLNRKKTKN